MNDKFFESYEKALSHARSEELKIEKPLEVKKISNELYEVVEKQDRKKINYSAPIKERSLKGKTPVRSSKFEKKTWSTTARSTSFFEEMRLEKKKEEAKKLKKDFEEKAAALEITERRPYLEKKKNEFLRMAYSELYEIWESKEFSTMEKDEISLLREIIRERRCIKPAPDVSQEIQICPKCSMLIDACACERGWW